MKLPSLYTFSDLQLAQTALTHRSFGVPNNERMEWLGDAIVQLEVSQLLYDRFPAMTEGGLSQIRTRLVSRQSLAAVARRIKLGAYARLSAAKIRNGRDNENLLANLMEAYIAAIYLDGGDVKSVLADLLAEDISALEAQIDQDGLRSLDNAKSLLQEWLQHHKLPLPHYVLTAQRGKADKPTFIVECRATDTISASGQGGSRIAAEQQAAADCLAKLTAAADSGRQRAKK